MLERHRIKRPRQLVKAFDFASVVTIAVEIEVVACTGYRSDLIDL